MRRLRRLALQFSLLPILYGLSLLDDRAFTGVVTVAIIIGWTISIAVALILRWLVVVTDRAHERDPLNPRTPNSLRDAADNAETMAVLETGLAAAAAAAVAIIRIVAPDVLPPGRFVVVLLGWSLVLLGVPAATWLRTLRTVWLPMISRRK